MASTKKDEYKQDPEWTPLNEQKFYTQEEYDAFHQRREQEIRKMIADGLVRNLNFIFINYHKEKKAIKTYLITAS